MRLDVFCIILAYASAWDAESHRIIARIAAKLIKNSKTKRFISDHLPLRPGSDLYPTESRLVYAAPWADTQQDTKEYHFSFTPYRACRAFDINEDCGVNRSGRCVVTGIEKAMREASNYSAPHESRSDALRLLVHIVGDAHHPLHTGFEEDRGGNMIQVIDPVDTDLHSVWDSYLLAKYKSRLNDAGQDSSWYAIAGAIIDELKRHPEQISAAELADISIDSALPSAARIVSETAEELTCSIAYKDELDQYIESPAGISSDYTSRAIDTMLRQFVRAGARLAQILDVVAEAFYDAESASVVRERGEIIGGVNRFSALENFEFDPEEAIMTLGPVEDEDSSDAQGGSADEEPESLEVPEAMAAGSPPKTKAERRTIRNRMRRHRDQAKKRMVEGISLDEIVLVKRRGAFLSRTNISLNPTNGYRLSTILGY